MNTPLAPFRIPDKWTGHVVKTPSGTVLHAVDARAWRDKNLRTSPVNVDHKDASLFSFDVDGTPTILCTREGYERLRSAITGGKG